MIPRSAVRSPARSGPGRQLRNALLAIGGLVALMAGIELAVPTYSAVPAAGLIDTVAVAAFTVAGLIAWYRRPHNRMGRLLIATAVALVISGMSDDVVPALNILGQLLGSVPIAVMLHLVLAFPSGRVLGRPAKITVGALYAVAILLQAPQLLVPPDVARVILGIQAILGVIGMAVAFALAVRRLSTAPRLIRRQLAPLLGYGSLAIVIIGVAVFLAHTNPDPEMANTVALIQVTALFGIPFAFLAAVLFGAFGRAGELEELAWGISEASTDPELLDRLAQRSLGDPTAAVYWAPSSPGGRFADSAGRPATERRPADRGWWRIGPPDAPVGALEYDRSLLADTDLIAAVSPPLALAITNRALVVELRAALGRLDEAAEQLRTSRRRIVIAADGERRRLARDLHDGAQQRIVSIGIETQRIGRRSDDAAFVRSVSASVTDQLVELLDELRRLVHGIMPAALEDRGLAAGVRSLADRMPIPVSVTTSASLHRLDPEVESTGYFVVAEALANVAKHAAATSATIDLDHSDGRLRISVTDDGDGPEGAEFGFGLRSLSDRVAAFDGTLILLAADDGGTTLRAELACG